MCNSKDKTIQQGRKGKRREGREEGEQRYKDVLEM